MKHLLRGYKIKDGEIVIDLKEAEKIRCLCKNYLSGMSFKKAAKQAGIELCVPSIKSLMFNEKYEGTEDYPAIYEIGTIEKLRRIRKIRDKKRNIKSRVYEKRKIRIYEEFVLLPYEKLYDSPKKQAEYIYGRIEGAYNE